MNLAGASILIGVVAVATVSPWVAGGIVVLAGAYWIWSKS